jgi:hypothetical protein
MSSSSSLMTPSHRPHPPVGCGCRPLDHLDYGLRVTVPINPLPGEGDGLPRLRHRCRLLDQAPQTRFRTWDRKQLRLTVVRRASNPEEDEDIGPGCTLGVVPFKNGGNIQKCRDQLKITHFLPEAGPRLKEPTMKNQTI